MSIRALVRGEVWFTDQQDRHVVKVEGSIETIAAAFDDRRGGRSRQRV